MGTRQAFDRISKSEEVKDTRYFKNMLKPGQMLGVERGCLEN